MNEQNYKNHRRFLWVYHALTLLSIIALLIGAIRNLIYSDRDNLYSASLLVLVALILASLYYHTRAFALKAQDRAIRAEEGLRHFILTGKALDPRLTLGQIIALRFASDEELPGLARRAAEEALTNDAIKKQIKNWRPDRRRV
jgi:heme exporter protein D